MSANSAPIRLRDTPAELQAKLGLSNQRFENFKNFARRAHNEYMHSHPNSRWADVSVVWTALPEQETMAATEIMYNLCRDGNLFPSTYPQQRIRDGILARLHQVRRTWQQGRRQPRGQQADDD
jgi:hypothetical protein